MVSEDLSGQRVMYCVLCTVYIYWWCVSFMVFHFHFNVNISEGNFKNSFQHQNISDRNSFSFVDNIKINFISRLLYFLVLLQLYCINYKWYQNMKYGHFERRRFIDIERIILYLFYLPQLRPSTGLHRYKGNPIYYMELSRNLSFDVLSMDSPKI